MISGKLHFLIEPSRTTGLETVTTRGKFGKLDEENQNGQKVSNADQAGSIERLTPISVTQYERPSIAARTVRSEVIAAHQPARIGKLH